MKNKSKSAGEPMKPKHSFWIIRFLSDKKNRFAIFTAVAAISLLMLAVSAKNIGQQREYKRFYNAAKDYYISGDYDSALGCIRRATAIEQRDDCVLLASDCYYAKGDLNKALELLGTLDAKDSNVSNRVNKIRSEQTVLLQNENVIVGGRVYRRDTKSLVLNGMDLRDSAVSELCSLYSLENLSLADNKISDISPLSGLGGLVSLDISRNSVKDISGLSTLSSLRSLYLDENPINDLSPLLSLVNLTTLSIIGVEIDAEQLAELSRALPDCAIHCEAAGEDIVDITLGGTTFSSDVKELDLSGLSIGDISALSNCKSLTKLILAGNNISDLSPLMDIPRLSYLDISDNNVSDLRPLMGVQRLTYLNASGNQIVSTVPLGMQQLLYELHIDNNPITDFSGIRKLSALKKLSVSNTGLQDCQLENFVGEVSLASIDIRDNPALSGEAVDDFRHCATDCNVISSDLPYSVVIGGKSFKNTDTVIDLNSAGLTDISQITSFLRPESVNLANNSISNVYHIQFCPTIKSLNLAGNLIEDVSALGALSQLESLDLSNNFIKNPSQLGNLSRLCFLNISGNKLTEEQMLELRNALPDCEIIF